MDSYKKEINNAMEKAVEMYFNDVPLQKILEYIKENLMDKDGGLNG